MSEEIFEGTIAMFDQQQAEAIEQIRRTHFFVVATMDPDTGQVEISVAGPNRYGMDMLPSFVGTVSEALRGFIEAVEE